MEISWYGHSCFRISEKGKATVVTDPFADSLGYPLPRLKGEVVTISHDAPGHNNYELVKGVQKVFDGPGEYEVGGVFIIGAAMHNHTTGKRNVAYLFDFEGVTVAHLGDLDHVPSQTEIEALGTVNIALVPVGGGGALNSAQAAEVIGLIEPSLVVPMHYQTEHAAPALGLDTLEKFLREMGVATPKVEDVLKIGTAALPETTQIVVLNLGR
jgi:L-ascorbate metabolism protein UlaG (beta-lactamase superfamily)